MMCAPLFANAMLSDSYSLYGGLDTLDSTDVSLVPTNQNRPKAALRPPPTLVKGKGNWRVKAGISSPIPDRLGRRLMLSGLGSEV